MDRPRPLDSPAPDGRIASAIDEYYDRRRTGEHLTPASFAAENPEIAEELEPYLQGLSLVDKVRRLAATGAELAETPAKAADLPRVPGYEVIEEVGRGGMGVVFRARQIATKRVVALKVLLAGPFASESVRRRFEREVELAARLQHPNIVRVLESGHVDQWQYYAMDFVVGMSLDRHLVAARPDVRRVLSLFERIAESVSYAHRHGVVHRDLKPANVLIDGEGEPHILDFGLAKATDRATTENGPSSAVSVPGQVLGTLPYLSPEQAAGASEDVDEQTDVYAMGVMLFEALTGQMPFDTSGRPSEVIERILEASPKSPSSLSKRVDNETETIILKAMAKHKAGRYQSAREVAADLGRYLGGEPILAKRPSRLYVIRKRLRKHRVSAFSVAAAALLVLAVVLTRTWHHHQELAEARLAALKEYQTLERGAGSRSLGPIKTLADRYGEWLPETRLMWAQALYRSDQVEDAILFLERGLRSEPSSWSYPALLADIYTATGNLERAGALRAQANRRIPDTAEAWYVRSFATMDLDRARQCADETVSRKPGHALAWRRLTALRSQTDDFEGAVRASDRLIELGEDAAEWLAYQAHLLVREERYRDAIELYSRVLRDHPEAWRQCVHRAHAYRRVGAHARAVDDYSRLIESEGRETAYLWHLYQRATPLWILGRREEAIEDYRRVRNLLGRPFYSDARRYLILRELGRREEAEDVLRTAMRDVADDPWLLEVFRCLAGEIGPEELIEAGVARESREQLCEAFYYAAEVCLLSGQLERAEAFLDRCVETGVQFDLDMFPAVPMNEYELAQWRLDTVFGTAGTASDQN